MKGRILAMVALSSFASCSDKASFEDIGCTPETVAVEGYLKKVFKPCREYVFSAKYWDKDYNLISDELIWMMATGNEWETDPENQSELIIQYDYDDSKVDFINQYTLNPELEHEWVRKEATGIIEDANETWMHPFRANQYAFTEMIPFPMVQVPLDSRQRWSAKVPIYEGWGRWSNSTAHAIYGVLGQELVTTEFKELNAWHVKANTSSKFGSAVNDFWYNEEYGFIKMVIKNYEGQLLVIELISVTE